MSAILKDLTAATGPLVRMLVDQKTTLRFKMVEALTEQLLSVKAAIEGKKFTKSRKVKGEDGSETMKDVRFRPNWGKNAFGKFVFEVRYGNRPLVLPGLKTHALDGGKDMAGLEEVISKLIKATQAGELDAVLIKQSNERKAQRSKKGQAVAATA